jgi:tetratricopeptide (TPR) repeat protein
MAGNLELAGQLVEQALIGARAYHDGWLEGWASQLLGRFALERGDLPEAERHLCHSRRLRREAGELQNQISDLTWLGRLRMAQARPDLALEHTGQAIAQLESLWGDFYVWEMQDVFLAHAEALAATGDATGARTYLQRAHETLMTFSAQIQDPEVRANFPAHKHNARIVAGWEAGQCSPPLPLHLPHTTPVERTS